MNRTATVKIIDKGLLEEISKYIIPTISDNELSQLLSTTKITMLIESNRLQSLILCELKQSYSIQSQRYCRYENLGDSVIFENLHLFSDEQQRTIRFLLKETLSLYKDMTEIKEGHENVTKFTKKDFVYGIPIDDGRFILPTAFTCNCEMTIDADKIIDFVNDIKNSGYFTDSFIDSFMNQLPYNIRMLLEYQYNKDKPTTAIIPQVNLVYGSITHPIEDLYETYGLDRKQRIILSKRHEIRDMKKTGSAALMCTTNNKSVEEIYKDTTDHSGTAITERVAYGTKHTSIAEHSFMTFVAKMSIACYNQYIRHRHHTVRRYKFSPSTFRFTKANDVIVNDIYVIPQSIKESKFYSRYILTMQMIENFINDVTSNMRCTEQIANALMQLLPMGTEITVVINTNLINELKNVSPKRTCMNAQWEIRKITHQKLEIISKLIGPDNKLLQWAKPNCLQECGCTEGKFACGDNREVRNLFNEV